MENKGFVGVFLILACVVRANLLRQAIRDFLMKITGTTQRTIWEQEGDERVFVRTRIGDVIDIIANNKITWIDKPGTSDYRRYWSMEEKKKSNVLPSYRCDWSGKKGDNYTCHVNVVNTRPLHSKLICDSRISFTDLFIDFMIQFARKVKYTISLQRVLSYFSKKLEESFQFFRCNDNDFVIVCTLSA